MSDTRAAMREFRFLDEKRTRGILSPAEEARWNELREHLVGQDMTSQEAAAEDPAQQPQGYYGEDGQWYAYPEGYDPNAQAYDPNAQGYDPNAQAYDPNAYAQQPQGYYGEDGQWYAYPEGYDPNAQAYDPNAQAYDPNAQAYAQQPQGYYGEDGQWYAYPAGYDPNAQAYDPNAQGYDPNAQAYAGYESQPAQEPYPAEPRQDYAADSASSQPTPAYASPMPGYVPQQAQPMPDPVKLSLETENLEVPALNEPAPWEEPTSEPIAELEASPEPESLDAEAEPLDAGPGTEDVFEVSDTDVSPVSEATPIPDNVPESVDMSDWNDVTTPSAASLSARQHALAVTDSTEISGPIELGEDDFSSLNSDPSSSTRISAPPIAGPPVAESRQGSQRTIEISASDIELLESDADVPLQAEPILAEEPTTPATDEWSSAPLALDAEPNTAPSQPAYGAGSPDVALLEDPDRMEITASYAIPATPPDAEPVPTLDVNDVQATADGTPTFELSELQASPEPAASPALETPWETSAEDLGAYGTSPDGAFTAQGGEQPTFDVGDLGAEMEPAAPASGFPSSEHVTTLELNPVQVAPDLHADTVEVADSFDPEAARASEWGVPANAEQTYDAGNPEDPVPLTSASDYLGHAEQGGTSVSDEPVPLEATGAEVSWTGSESTGEGLQLESAAEYMSTPQFAEASATWGHQPEGEQPVAETADPESTTAYGSRLGHDAGMETGEAQPEWSAAAEQQPVLEAQPEWNAASEEQAPVEVQSEWMTPEPSTATEAQPEWNAAAAEQPVLEAQPEWSTAESEPAATAEPQPEWAAPAEEQPVMEAQPEWAAPAEEQPAAEQQPVMEVQAEWVTAEPQPTEAQPEWAAPAEEQPVMEAQPEWAAPAEEQPVMEAQPEWAAPAEEQPVMEAQPEWSAPAEEQPVMEAQPEWSAPAEEQPVMEAQPEWSAPAEEQPVMEAQPEWSAPAEEQPVMEAQPE
ncbi:MAG: hypothetical protein ACJ8AN_08165, partial [Archangium sp.]